MNIFLIGYRGTGKTSVARRLAATLGWESVDADVEVEQAAGMSIAEVFERHGEPWFRDLETETLRTLLAAERRVVALGGGAILREENRRRLARGGRVVWLKATAETIHGRLTDDPKTAAQRPNLTAVGGLPEIRRVLAEREAIYRQCADHEVDTEEKTVDEVADEILARLQPSPDTTGPV